MVVGNGLLANCFESFKDNNDILIYASGVSNSKEINDNEFVREKTLLMYNLKKYSKHKFIYFSTTSVYDMCLKDSKYVKHKLDMEKNIIENSNNYIIFRLPIIASKSNNPYTLLNNFYNKIIKNEIIEILNNATRYIIDIDDVYQSICKFIKINTKNEIVNICYNRFSILQIIKQFELILNKNIDIKIVNGGCDTVVDNEVFMKTFGTTIPKDNYLFTTLDKYYSTQKTNL